MIKQNHLNQALIRNGLRAFCAFLWLFIPLAIWADDVGLISAQLIEKENNTYILKVDAPPMLLSAVQAPILPEAFSNGKTIYDRQGALINVSYPFSGDRPLAPNDTLLLPWQRTGVLLSCTWADGSQQSAMFLTRLEGIPIEIKQLRPIQRSHAEQIRRAFSNGFRAASSDWKLWIPILVMALIFPTRRALHFLFMLMAGFSASLILSDFQGLEIPQSFAVGMFLIATLMALRIPKHRLAPLFIFSAVLLGLSFQNDTGYDAHMACILGTLLFFIGGGALLIFLRRWLPLPDQPRIITATIGAFAVAGILSIIFNQETAPLEQGVSVRPIQAPSKTNTKQPPRTLTNPFMGFLTIEPYEVRIELLASGKAITDRLAFPLAHSEVISIDEQDLLKQQALQSLGKQFELLADDAILTPALKRGDFLTLGAAGAFTRGEAVDEPISSAILGLTFVYIRPNPPQELSLNWNELPAQKLPMTIIDPSGNQGVTFTPDTLSNLWKNNDVFQTQERSAVGVEHPTWAPLALVVLMVALVGFRKPKSGYAFIAASICLLPFGRMSQPFGTPITPNQAEPVVKQLLTNVYHAFDFREESAIYDQLAISVDGDQLTDIYLEQRSALELENRGGARARVEAVQIDAIDAISKSDNGITIRARWNVSGSVNHFGHTHFRQNAYHATLHLSDRDGIWKITGIDVHEEERVY